MPLAPQRVLTQYGLQGVTTRDGLVAFLTRSTNQRSDGDYALGLYVMLSRARQLDDLFLVDLPERKVVESLLTSANPTLVQRMRHFEQQAKESTRVAQGIAHSLGWQLWDFELSSWRPIGIASLAGFMNQWKKWWCWLLDSMDWIFCH